MAVFCPVTLTPFCPTVCSQGSKLLRVMVWDAGLYMHVAARVLVAHHHVAGGVARGVGAGPAAS